VIYVGVGQVADVPESEQRSYAFVLCEARTRHGDKAVAALERLGPPPRASASSFTPRDWIKTFGGSFHGPMTYRTLPGQSLGQREVNGRDLVGFQSSAAYSDQPVQTEFAHFVIDDRPHRFTAPRTTFVWFENSAHNPPFEEPKAFTDWISRNVAPLGDRGRAGP
jgi:hypothetical protein